MLTWISSKLTSSSPIPQPHKPYLWTGGKLLGKGGNGQVTLWTYIGTRNPRTEKFPHLIDKSIVMKTPLDELTRVAFKSEYYVMNELLKRNETHLTRIITGFGPYDRIYLEFCERGDLEREIKRRRSGKRDLGFTEEHLWTILRCLAKSAVAMARVDPPDGRQILHMDMHAGNVLAGDIGGNHSCKTLRPQYKVSDFGVVMEWNSQTQTPHDNPDGIDQRQNYAAEFFYTEQFSESAPPPTIGEKCNIWGIGIIMYQALLLSDTPPTGDDPDCALPTRYKSTFGAGILPADGWRYGRLLETANMYSEELRVTVQHCLMESYEHRIGSQELLEKAETVAGRWGVEAKVERGLEDWILVDQDLFDFSD